MPDIDRSFVINPTEIEIEDSAGAWVVLMPGLVPTLAMATVLLLVVTVMRARRRRGIPAAREILDRRLAAGQIDLDGYRAIRAALEESATD
jgi:uncharacterized membrane protein